MAIERTNLTPNQELFLRVLNDNDYLPKEDLDKSPSFTNAGSKLAHHFDIVDDLLNKRARVPLSMEVDISYVCGDGCVYCHFAYTHENPINPNRQNIMPEVIEQRFMLPPLAEKIFRDMHESGVKSVVFSGGGEPLDSPYALDIFHLARESNLKMGIYTRGFGLKGDQAAFVAENFDWVVVSLDVTNPAEHKEVKGTGARIFETKVKNIKDFLKLPQRTSNLSVSCMVGPEHLETVTPYLNQLPFINFKPGGITKIERDMLWLLSLEADEVHIRPIVDTGSYEQQIKDRETGGLSHMTDREIWQQHYSWIPPMVEVLQRYRGIPGLNVSLDKFVDLYNGTSGFETCDAMLVSAGLVETDGTVAKCVNLRKIVALGNLKQQSLREIFLKDNLDRDVNDLCRAGCRGCKVNIFMREVREKGTLTQNTPGKHFDFI